MIEPHPIIVFCVCVGYVVIGGVVAGIFHALVIPDDTDYSLTFWIGFCMWPWSLLVIIGILCFRFGRWCARAGNLGVGGLPALVLLACADCQAACPQVAVKKQVIVSAVPSFAQTVNVVRSSPSFWYGTDPNAYRQSSASDELLERLERIERLLSQGGAVRAAEVDPLRLTRQACAKCHTGAQAKGGFSVDGDLSCEDRLRAVSMLLHDDASKRMPKGRPLDAQSTGLIIQELSKRPTSGAVRTADVPPLPAEE